MDAFSRSHRRTVRAAGRVGDAERRAHLQPVHLLPILMGPLHRRWERLLIALFVATIAVPGLATIPGIDRPDAATENRTLAPFPTLHFDLASLGAFPDAFTKYFEDNFSFRTRLVKWQAAFRFRELN